MGSQTDLVARYLRFREIGKRLNLTMTERTPTDVLQEGGRDLGLFRKGTFVFGSEDETSVLIDYCIYNVRRQGCNAVQTLLAQSPPADGSEESLVLDALTRTWYSVFTIETVESGVGVRVRDILRETEHLLIDMGLSRSAVRGDMLATRVVPFDGFIITTGAGLPLGGNNRQRDALLAQIKKVAFEKNISSFEQLTPEQEKALARSIIVAALASGASEKIRYQDPDEPVRRGPAGYSQRESLVPIQSGGQVGRNDRCPCGSGKKYKHCCGK
jgi:hypothetical protein